MAAQEYCVGAASSSSTAFVEESSPTSNKATSVAKASQGMEISGFQLTISLILTCITVPLIAKKNLPTRFSALEKDILKLFVEGGQWGAKKWKFVSKDFFINIKLCFHESLKNYQILARLDNGDKIIVFRFRFLLFDLSIIFASITLKLDQEPLNQIIWQLIDKTKLVFSIFNGCSFV